MLHDQIICGLSDSQIQHRLLTEPKLTFAKAVELSQSMESAEKNSKTILSQRDTAEVHLTRIICYHCGNEHSPDTCAFKESYCRKCSKKGHIARACCSRQTNVNRQGTERTLHDHTNSHMELNKLSPQRLKKSSQILCTIHLI